MFRKLITGLLILFISSAVAAAPKQYKLMGDRLPGTKFKQVIATSPIPFDKKYDELTAEQKQIIRANYGGLKDSEKPPFPANGTKSIYKAIHQAHKDIARPGSLFLIAMVDETGKVENVSVYQSPHDSMTQFATNVLFNTPFEPATCAGTPCKMEFLFEQKLRHWEGDGSTTNYVRK